MDRKTINKLKEMTLMAIGFATAAGCNNTGKEEAKKDPNIIFVMVDDMGYADIGSYGQDAYATPHLDGMASQGMRFTHAYSGCTVCAPARSTLMTGLHTGHTQVRGNTGGIPLPNEAVTIAEVLQKDGYACGGFGKWGLGDLNTEGVPENQGFDTFYGYYHQIHAHYYYPEYLINTGKKVPLPANKNFYEQHDSTGGMPVKTNGQEYKHSNYLIFDKMKEWIRNHQDNKFFCYAPWTPPHARYEIPKNDPAWQVVRNKPWSTRAKGHAAFNMIVDRQMGELFDLLNELNLQKETIVFFCSDNGASNRFENSLNSCGNLRGQKRSMYEGGLRVPLIVKWPDKIRAGTTSDLPVYFPDIFPTLAELANINTGMKKMDGISFLPELTGKKKQEKHNYMYWELPIYEWSKREYSGKLQQAVRHDQWKMVRHNDEKPWELYNLSRDPAESNNIAEKHPEIIEEMNQWVEKNRLNMIPQKEPEMPEGKRYR
jgi:arylsulfatase A-like enzyme